MFEIFPSQTLITVRQVDSKINGTVITCVAVISFSFSQSCNLSWAQTTGVLGRFILKRDLSRNKVQTLKSRVSVNSS